MLLKVSSEVLDKVTDAIIQSKEVVEVYAVHRLISESQSRFGKVVIFSLDFFMLKEDTRGVNSLGYEVDRRMA